MIAECDQCGKRYDAPDHLAGRKMRCKYCQALFTLPSPQAGNEPGVFDEPAADSPFPPVRKDEKTARSFMARSQEPVEAFDFAVDSGPARRPTRLWNYPYSAEVDQYTPWLLMGLCGYLLLAQSQARNDTAADWGAWMRVALWVGLHLAITLPLSLAALRAAARRQNYELPLTLKRRVLAMLALPLLLGGALWLIAGAWSDLLWGWILGMVLAAGAGWLLLRLRWEEIGQTAMAFARAALIGLALVMGILVGGNFVINRVLLASQKPTQLAASPLGPGLMWPAPPPPAPRIAAGRPVVHPPATPPSTRPASSSLSPTATAAAPTSRPHLAVRPPHSSQQPATASANQLPASQPAPGPDEVPDFFGTNHAEGAPSPGPTSQGPRVNPPSAPNEEMIQSVARSPLVQSVVEPSPLGVFQRLLLPRVAEHALAVVLVKSDGPGKDRLEQWQLDPAVKTAEAIFRQAPDQSTVYQLRPDMDLTARLVRWPTTAAQVWSFSRKNVLVQLDLNAAAKPAGAEPLLLGFVGPDKLLVRWEAGNLLGAEIWDIKTSRSVRAFDLANYDDEPGNLAISPDGKYLAVATRRRDAEILLYDLTQPRQPRSILITDLDSRWPVRAAGMAFSPDGSKIAILFERDGNGLLLVYAVAGGKRLTHQIYPAGLLPENLRGGNPALRADGTVASSPRDELPLLSWVDDAHLMLGGRQLLDATSGKSVGRIDLPDAVGQRMLDGKRCLILRATGEGNRRLLLLQLKMPPADHVD